jgi:ribosomal protein S27AE
LVAIGDGDTGMLQCGEKSAIAAFSVSMAGHGQHIEALPAPLVLASLGAFVAAFIEFWLRHADSQCYSWESLAPAKVKLHPQTIPNCGEIWLMAPHTNTFES